VSICTLAVLLCACDARTPAWRSYEEVFTQTIPAVPAAPAAHPEPRAAPHRAAIQWKAPAGWRDAGPAGMRLATFSLGNAPQTGLCTIIRMGAAAGDLEANTRRWMQQVRLADPEPARLSAFLAQQATLQTEGGWPATVVDLTTWPAENTETESMIAGLVSPGDQTLFLKLTGPRPLLDAERAAFRALVQSLRPGVE
jgi:hypothetical protein